MSADLVNQLRAISEEIRTWEERGNSREILELTERLQQAATEVAGAWSGSCFGYHSRVYYEGFAVPPPGAHFSSEWGFYGVFQGTTGNWREYQYEEVVRHIYHLAGDPDLTQARALSQKARKAYEEAQAEVASIISAFLSGQNDEFLTSLKHAVENIIVLTVFQGLKAQLPNGTFMSRDTLAISQGRQTAPHQEVIAEVVAIQSAFTACSELGTLGSRAAAHVERLDVKHSGARAQGESVFIGHGRSLLWRELKDFIRDRLHLPWGSAMK